MGLCLEKCRWNNVKKEVVSLYYNNKYLTPYSSFYFLNIIKQMPNIHQIKDSFKCKFYCYKLKKNDNVIAVIPLYVDKSSKKIFLLGHFSSVGHLDIIYSKSFNIQNFKTLLLLLGNEYQGYTFEFDRISQYSKTFMFLSKFELESKKNICVRIDISRGYEEWFSCLSKNCRQNIRTSYNRIAKEKVKLDYVSYIRKKPKKIHINDNLNLFAKRILEHCNLNKTLYIPMLFLKKTEPITKALFGNEDIIFASIYLNRKLAASCNGVIANDGRAIITRLSIDSKMGKYSPGGLIINELIKECAREYPSIKSIDLSRGNEKYKYVYGGYEHYNYAFEVRL